MCDIHRSTLTTSPRRSYRRRWRSPSATGIPGRDLLVALAAGFEGHHPHRRRARLPGVPGKGWHGPGVLGPFSARPRGRRLLGLAVDTMARHLGLAGSQAAGTFAAWGTRRSNSISAAGALSGLLRRCWAAEVSSPRASSSPPGTVASSQLRRW